MFIYHICLHKGIWAIVHHHTSILLCINYSSNQVWLCECNWTCCFVTSCVFLLCASICTCPCFDGSVFLLVRKIRLSIALLLLVGDNSWIRIGLRQFDHVIVSSWSMLLQLPWYQILWFFLPNCRFVQTDDWWLPWFEQLLTCICLYICFVQLFEIE